MGKIIIFSVLVVFIIGGTLVEAGDPQKNITIGVSAFYSGAFAATGKSVSDGALDYLNWIASRGGIEYKDLASGKKEKGGLRIIWEDNAYDVAKSITVYKRLKARGVNVILGLGSTPGEACAATASRDKLPFFNIYGTASPAGYKPKPQYYFCFQPTIGEVETPPIKWFIKQKWQSTRIPKIGILCLDVPSWRIIGKPGQMDSYVKRVGGELVGIEFVPPLITDMSVPISRLVLEKKADCLFLIGILAQTVVMAKDLQRMGIDTKKTTVMCATPSWDESLFKSIPKEIEGLYGQSTVALSDENVPGMRKVKEIAKWAGRSPEEIIFNYSNGIMGSMVLEGAIKEALEKKGYQEMVKSGEILREVLSNFKGIDTGGLAPSLEVKYPDYPYFINYTLMVEAKGGKFKKIGDWEAVDRIEGAID
jgi:hypothetical protein